MKILQSTLFRALIALAIGVLLIKYPDNTLTGLTIAIGVMFLISGVVSILTWLYAKKHASEYVIYDANGLPITGSTPTPPFVGIGSVILGCILAFMPETFVKWQMYVIGIVLVIGALNQYMNLIAARHYGRVPVWYWLFTTVVLLAVIFVMVYPIESASVPFIILGWTSLLYGVTEILIGITAFTLKRTLEKQLKAEAEQNKENAEYEEIKETENKEGETNDIVKEAQ